MINMVFNLYSVNYEDECTDGVCFAYHNILCYQISFYMCARAVVKKYSNVCNSVVCYVFLSIVSSAYFFIYFTFLFSILYTIYVTFSR